MGKGTEVESVEKFRIVVENLVDGRVRVQMFTKEIDFYGIINATQYMMWQTARKIDLPFDEALEKLCEGARNYHAVVYVLPEKDEEEVKQMRKTLCDLCGAEITEARPDEIHSNLWVVLDEYMIKIDITKGGMITHFCRDCRTQLVSHALLQDDPFFGLILDGDDKRTERKKRKDREAYSFERAGRKVLVDEAEYENLTSQGKEDTRGK